MKKLLWFGIGIWLGALVAFSMADAGELPIPATPDSLVADTQHYDGQKVFLTGTVSAVWVVEGTMGSEYFRIDVTEGGATVAVFLPTFMKNVHVGDVVSVQGVFHKEAYFGGRPETNWIALDALFRDRR